MITEDDIFKLHIEKIKNPHFSVDPKLGVDLKIKDPFKIKQIVLRDDCIIFLDTTNSVGGLGYPIALSNKDFDLIISEIDNKHYSNKEPFCYVKLNDIILVEYHFTIGLKIEDIEEDSYVSFSYDTIRSIHKTWKEMCNE